jgi:microcystin-dependent protein
MPRNSQGVYSLPAGNPVVSGTLIETTWANPTMSDIAAALTGSLPRDGSAGMTGPLVLARDGVLSLEAVTVQQMQSSLGGAGNFLPAGAIQLFAMNVIPSGWLECNGAAISRATYAQLFNTIGTTYGAGDGSITFNIPDMRGQFARGWDNGRGVDPGRALGSLQGSANQAHNHTVSVTNPSHSHSVSDPGHTHSLNDPGHNHTATDAGHTHLTKMKTRVTDIAVGPTDLVYVPEDSDPFETATELGFANITVAAHGTGVAAFSSATGLGVAAATQATTVTVAGEGSESRPTNLAMVYCIKVFGAVQTDGLGTMAFQNADAVAITAGSGVFTSLQCTTPPTQPNDVARLSDIGNQLADIFSSDPDVLLVDKTNPTNPILRPQTNIPNGMVKLDAAGFVPNSVLTISDLTFMGTWDASSGLLPPGTFVTGDYYLIDVAGTLTLETSGGSVAQPCNVGDSIIYKTTPVAGWWYQPVAVASNLPATSVSFAPGGTIIATNVQTAIGELDSETQAALALKSNITTTVEKTSSIGAANIPAGLVTDRPASPVNGQFRYNSTDGVFEGYKSGVWGEIPTGSFLPLSGGVLTGDLTGNTLIKTPKAQLGLSVTPANNFTLDASADDGTMKLARNSGQDIMTVAADGKVAFPATPGTVLQKLVFDGGTFATPVSVTSPTNVINSVKAINPRSTNSTLLVEASVYMTGTTPGTSVNLTRFARLFEGTSASPFGAVRGVAAINGAGSGMSPLGSAFCQGILSNTALTPRSFGLAGYISGTGEARYNDIILTITEIQN